MLNIEKKKTEKGYEFIISTGQEQFSIIYDGSSDLCWIYIPDRSQKEKPLSKTFIIEKEDDGYLYSLFENLYDDVKDCRVFKITEDDIKFCNSNEELEAKKQNVAKLNNRLKISQGNDPERLFKDGVIEWHCDDFYYEESSILKIEKQNNSFSVTFIRSNVPGSRPTYSVKIRRNGSRYSPFDNVFMKMYQDLITYEPDNHSIEQSQPGYQKKLRI